MLAKVVKQFVAERRGNEIANGRFLLAISGGADSLALLHAATTVFPACQLAVAHLDHCLRPSSGEDAEFVRQTAVSHQIPCFIKKVDVAALAEENGWGIEEAGRKVRYQFFADVAQKEGITAVLVAHNADDQAETVLMNLLRGSGMRGLQGMAAVRQLAEQPSLWLLRPLLTVSRAEIEAYCQEHQLQPRFDASNLDPVYFRNRIRNELLPLLQIYSPQVKQHLQQTAVLLAADNAWLEEATEGAWQDVLLKEGAGWLLLRREGWGKRPLALQRRLLRQAIHQVAPADIEIGFQTLEAARRLADSGQTGARAMLPGGTVLKLTYDALQIGVRDSLDVGREDWPQVARSQPLLVPGELLLENGWQLQAAWLDPSRAGSIQGNQDAWQAFVDVAGPLLVRGRQAGERLQPLGMNGRSSKIKDVMINRKIPAASRANWPLVVAESHHFWLVGHCVDERARVTAVHDKIIHLRCWQANP
ncbi:MAG: tRNA lysidine(34) synthetase TilS [Chloroflexota bacterium]